MGGHRGYGQEALPEPRLCSAGQGAREGQGSWICATLGKASSSPVAKQDHFQGRVFEDGAAHPDSLWTTSPLREFSLQT